MSGDSELGPAGLAAVMAGFAERLRLAESELNALNVFPVADNDTGTNMLRSVDAIVAAIEDTPELEPGVVADAALEGRGNSGLIVGQFLSGLTATIDGDLLDLAEGLAAGAAAARAAVVHPVEGTMLTVADAVAAAAATDARPIHLAAVAADAVAATPQQLPALGGVVDSGAAGLALFFEALAAAVDGEAVAGHEPVIIECFVGMEPPPGPPPGRRVVGHEIQFRIPAGTVDSDVVRALLEGLGTDVVVVTSDDGLAAHVHVVDASVATNAISAELEDGRAVKAISYDVEPLLEIDPA